MNWDTKSNTVCLELAISWLRQTCNKLREVLAAVEQSHDYRDEYIKGSVKSMELSLRQIRKFIENN